MSIFRRPGQTVPDTEQVRLRFAGTWGNGPAGDSDLFDAWLAEHDAQVRDDERAGLFSELTRGQMLDGDFDRVIKAAYRRREAEVPVLTSRASAESGTGESA